MGHFAVIERIPHAAPCAMPCEMPVHGEGGKMILDGVAVRSCEAFDLPDADAAPFFAQFQDLD
jgi:hypothetical protein